MLGPVILLEKDLETYRFYRIIRLCYDEFMIFIDQKFSMVVLQGVNCSLLFFICLGLCIQCFGFLALIRFKLKAAPILKPTPTALGVSIIKPCFSTLDHEEENFKTFFNQDYLGPIQFLFVVSQPSDPIVPVIKKLMKEFSHLNIELIISHTRQSYWLKIDALYDAQQYARHELIIWSDSDVVVTPHYVSQMAHYLQQPDIGLVTTPQYDYCADNFVTHVKALGNNADLAAYVMLYDALIKNKTVAFGHSMGFRKSDFMSFEKHAWKTLRQSFADDLIIPKIFSQHGKKVFFASMDCPVRFSHKTFKDMLSQQKRFALCQRASLGGLLYASFLLVSPVFCSLLFLLIFPSLQALLLVLTVIVVRIGLSCAFEGLILKSFQMNKKYFWVIPIWDGLKIYFVVQAIFKNKVYYHGKCYRLEKNLNLVELKT